MVGKSRAGSPPLIALLLFISMFAWAQDAGQGAVLAGLGGCAACHTAKDGEPYAGGHIIESDWGEYVGPNITPDPAHGIGGWAFPDFQRAMRDGRNPDGHSYYPAFPFASFTGMTDDDLKHLWAFLKSIEPVARPNQDHSPSPMAKGRWKLGFWRLGGFKRGPSSLGLAEDEQLERGRYLATAVGHCGDCHTPRGPWGVPKKQRYLQGTDDVGEGGPNITRNELSDWTERNWRTFLKRGQTPDGDYVGGGMWDVIDFGTANLSKEDQAALGAYLMRVGES